MALPVLDPLGPFGHCHTNVDQLSGWLAAEGDGDGTRTLPVLGWREPPPHYGGGAGVGLVIPAQRGLPALLRQGAGADLATHGGPPRSAGVEAVDPRPRGGWRRATKIELAEDTNAGLVQVDQRRTPVRRANREVVRQLSWRCSCFDGSGEGIHQLVVPVPELEPIDDAEWKGDENSRAQQSWSPPARRRSSVALVGKVGAAEDWRRDQRVPVRKPKVGEGRRPRMADLSSEDESGREEDQQHPGSPTSRG